MDARLTILFGPVAGQTIPIPAGELVIGREEGCHVRSGSDFVSRRHCRLLFDNETLRIDDLGSKNGTFVNSCRVAKIGPALAHGDIVSVGDIVFQIELGAPAGERGLPFARENARSPALEGTGVFEGDTIQTQAPARVSLPAVASAPPPVVPTPAAASPIDAGHRS